MLSLADIDERIEHWQRLRTSLTSELRAVATQLSNPGNPPGVALESSLEVYSREVNSLLSDLGVLESSQASPHTAILSRRSLLERTVRVLQDLARVADIRVSAGDDSILDPVRQLHSDVIRQLEQSPWQYEELLQEIEVRQHALCRLLDLMQAPETLSDDDWTREIRLVQEQFGTSLSTAISRGRVHLKPLE